MIIIHAAGNKDIGMGNLARTAYLSEYLINISEVVLLWETDNATADFLTLSNPIRKIIVPNRTEAIRILNDICKDNIYITDILYLDEHFGNLIKQFGAKKHIHINDSIGSGYMPDILIDEDPFEKEKHTAKEACYFGTDYKIFKKDMLSFRPEKATSAFKKVLISFGGSDPAQYTEKTAEIAYKHNLQNIGFVLGPLMQKERKDICKQYATHCKIYENVQDMAPLISSYHIIIGLGGITAYESALLGKAVIAIKWSHMAYYAENLEKLGMLFCLENLEELEKFLVNINNYIPKMTETAKKGFEMVSGTGGYKVTEIIRNIL